MDEGGKRREIVLMKEMLNERGIDSRGEIKKEE